MKNFHFRFTKGSSNIEAYGTNGTQWARCMLECDQEMKSDFILGFDHRLLGIWMNRIGKKDIDVKISQSIITFSSGKDSVDIPYLEGNETMEYPNDVATKYKSMPGEKLLAAMSMLADCTADVCTLGDWGSFIALTFKGDKFVGYGSEGHVFNKISMELPQKVDSKKIFLRGSGVGRILKVVGDSEEVGFYTFKRIDTEYLVISGDGIEIIVPNQIAEEYPIKELNQLIDTIPNVAPARCSVQTRDLQDTFKEASSFHTLYKRDTATYVILKNFSEENSTITVKIYHPDDKQVSIEHTLETKNLKLNQAFGDYIFGGNIAYKMMNSMKSNPEATLSIAEERRDEIVGPKMFLEYFYMGMKIESMFMGISIPSGTDQ